MYVNDGLLYEALKTSLMYKKKVVSSILLSKLLFINYQSI